MINRRLPLVIVPLDSSSLDALYEQRDDQGNYFVLPMSREDLGILFREGFFDNINSKFGLLIDEYEEVGLTNFRIIRQLLAYLQETNFQDPICRFYANKLSILLSKALQQKTSVLFYL